eukprot:m.37914 g.37914  ORF g.37914 m.37914 type:complete len:380 (-) comp12556_c0_seq1:96-1235(-)
MAALRCRAVDCAQLRRQLELSKAYDASRKITPDSGKSGFLLVPINSDVLLPPLSEDVERVEAVLPASATAIAKHHTPYQTLLRDLQQFVLDLHLSPNAAVVGSEAMPVPRRWEQHGDLVLLSDSAFAQPAWQPVCQHAGFWQQVATSLRCQRLAVKSVIADTLTRDAQVSLKVGDDGWVTQTDNGIRCTWDVTTCMFSAGNITEKLRVAKLPCEDQVVVDLFAGIGYFTLPYLVHAKAACVHACEWNPHAVEALKRNLELNGVQDRCIVYQGDNNQVAPHGVADHVNLGLIPTSANSWATALRCLKPCGGVLHVHENVTTETGETDKQAWGRFGDALIAQLKMMDDETASMTIQHIECVKSYAPRIYHMVYDVAVTRAS